MKQQLYLFVGYPGAGKTTIAKMIAKFTGAVHLWADFERHIMFGQATHSKEESRALYNRLNQVADELLSQGQSVIYDTNFNFRKDRDHMRKLAAKHGAKTVLIWVTTPREIAENRATKDSEGQDTRIWGNMDPADFKRMSNNLQRPDSDEQVIEVDGSKLDAATLKQQLGL